MHVHTAHPEHFYSYRMNFAMLSISEPSCCPLNHGPWYYGIIVFLKVSKYVPPNYFE